MNRWIAALWLIILAQTGQVAAEALQPRVRTSHFWEIHANTAISKPGLTDFPLSYVLVPSSWVQVTGPWSSHAALRDLIREGEFTRFPIHPADKVHAVRLRRTLELHGYSAKVHRLNLVAQRTSSRSSFLPTLPNGLNVSIRLSVSEGFGPWGGSQEVDPMQGGHGVDYNKGISGASAQWAQEVSDHLAARAVQWERSYRALGEVMTVVARPPGERFDLGYSFRDLSLMSRRLMLPSFSTLHPERAALIALLNSDEPALTYWARVDGIARGDATADFFADALAVFTSAHGQNSGIELDDDLRPTGHAFLRDLGDSYFPQPVHAYLPADTLSRWRERFAHRLKAVAEMGAVDEGKVHIPVSWTHGNRAMVSREDADLHTRMFQEAFLSRLADRARFPLAELKSLASSVSSSNGYNYLVFDGRNPIWARFMTSLIRHRDDPWPADPAEKDRPSDRPGADILRKAAMGEDLAAEAARISVYETIWHSLRDGPDRRRLTAALVWLGTREPKVLMAQLKDLRAPAITRIAIEGLRTQCPGRTDIALALASAVGKHSLKPPLEDLTRLTLDVLKSCRPDDPSVFIAAYQRERINFRIGSEFIEAFKHLTTIPRELADEWRVEISSRIEDSSKHYLVSSVGPIELLARDPNHHEFLLNVARAIEATNTFSASRIRELVASARRVGRCESLLRGLWPRMRGQ